MRRRQTWHRFLHVVAWAVLMFFLATVLASSILGIINALK
jgi:hypothetical protein